VSNFGSSAAAAARSWPASSSPDGSSSARA
jgi:hypothetical protein